jgi:GH25 family lysozyme M1 (1,4-beta-N-acetylmuramidase)
MIFGIDISNWQSGINYNILKQNGIDFAIIKSTEGEGFKDAMFTTHLNGCRNAGMVVAAYHFVRGGNAEAQLNNIKSMVPKDIPVILDIEDGAGDMNSIRRLLTLLQNDGYKTPLIYMPEWYWKKIGSPSLAGLPANWWSWYPDNSGQSRTLTEGISMVPERIWSGFGGLLVQIVQFTSTGRVLNSNRQPVGYNANLDLNAYKGSIEDLYNLFSQKSQSGGGVDGVSADDVTLGLYQTRVDGRNVFDWFKQNSWDQDARTNKILESMNALALLVGKNNDVDEEAIAKALVPALLAALPEQLNKYNDDQVSKISKAVNDEMARRQAN